MARLFTVDFTFNGLHYNTLVTVKTTPFYMEYTLNNLDAGLLLQLPGNRLISPSSNQFLFPNAECHHSTVLMNTIIKAVSQHLETVTGA